MAKIANYLGKTILVSLPKIHGDGQPRPFTLVGVEDCGLWLENEDDKCFAGRNNGGPVMIPFAQIAYLAFGISAPPPPAQQTAKEPERSRRSKEDKQRYETKRKR